MSVQVRTVVHRWERKCIMTYDGTEYKREAKRDGHNLRVAWWKALDSEWLDYRRVDDAEEHQELENIYQKATSGDDE